MQIQHISLVVVALGLAGVAWPGTSPRLAVDVPPAAAAVPPPVEGRLVRLPALEFDFALDVSCAHDEAMKSGSISVADSRKTLTGNEIPDVMPFNVPVNLPARQIPPVAVDGLCSDTATGEGGSPLLSQDVATAQVSLRCSGPDGDSIRYSSASLDVTLACEGETQGSAPASTDR